MQKVNEHLQSDRPRVLLVNPPYYRLFKNTYSYNKYPLSLGYLAAAIKEKTGWTPIVYNADFAVPSEKYRISYLSGEGFSRFRSSLQDQTHPIWAEIRTVLKESKPMVVGITCCAATSKAAAIIASIAKAIDKRIIVVFGGPHPTLIGKDALTNPDVDVVVKGEGENTIVELLNEIEHSGRLEAVKGIICRVRDEVVETMDREPIKSLDSLSFPSKWAKETLKDYNRYPNSAFSTILATRGCPANCFFCGSRAVFSRKTRFRSVENVVDEIKQLRSIGLKRFEFVDDTFGVNKTYLRELCKSIAENCPGIKWSCTTRINLLDEESVKLMKKAGCYLIETGVESGNNEILRQMRKGITIEEAVSAARIVKKQDIVVRWNFLLGFPTETEQTMNDTIKAMVRFEGRVGYGIFTPYPGSEAYEYCKKTGLISYDFDASLHNHQSPENCFCFSISKERFRAIASEIERYVDRKNAMENFKQLLSFSTIEKLLNFGVFSNMNSLKSFARTFVAELSLFLSHALLNSGNGTTLLRRKVLQIPNLVIPNKDKDSLFAEIAIEAQPKACAYKNR